MASGHVNRTQRPNTWLHRPTCVREESPCQLGAVHTWHFSRISRTAPLQPLLKQDRTNRRLQPHQIYQHSDPPHCSFFFEERRVCAT